MYQTQLGEDINAIYGITKALPYTKEETQMQPTGSLKSALTTAQSHLRRGESRFNQNVNRIQCDPLLQKFSHSLIFVFILFFLTLCFYTLAPATIMFVRLVLTITVISFVRAFFASAALPRFFFAGTTFPFS